MGLLLHNVYTLFAINIFKKKEALLRRPTAEDSTNCNKIVSGGMECQVTGCSNGSCTDSVPNSSDKILSNTVAAKASETLIQSDV